MNKSLNDLSTSRLRKMRAAIDKILEARDYGREKKVKYFACPGGHMTERANSRGDYFVYHRPDGRVIDTVQDEKCGYSGEPFPRPGKFFGRIDGEFYNLCWNNVEPYAPADDYVIDVGLKAVEVRGALSNREGQDVPSAEDWRTIKAHAEGRRSNAEMRNLKATSVPLYECPNGHRVPAATGARSRFAWHDTHGVVAGPLSNSGVRCEFSGEYVGKKAEEGGQ